MKVYDIPLGSGFKYKGKHFLLVVVPQAMRTGYYALCFEKMATVEVRWDMEVEPWAININLD